MGSMTKRIKSSVANKRAFIALLDHISRKTVVKNGPGGEWHTGATGDNGGVERFVYQTRAET